MLDNKFAFFWSTTKLTKISSTQKFHVLLYARMLSTWTHSAPEQTLLIAYKFNSAATTNYLLVPYPDMSFQSSGQLEWSF